MATQTLPPLLNSAIKELSSSVSSVSSLYASQNPEAADLEPVVEEEIPAIDFFLLTQGTPEQRSQIVHDIGKACEDWGSFMVVNHGVPERLRAAMMDALKGFFDLTAEEKMEYRDKRVLDPIRYGTSFNTGVEDVRFWRDYLKVMAQPEFHSPAKPPGLRDILQEYSTVTKGVTMELLKGVWESLGVEESYMKEALGLDSCFQVIVGNLYPPCPQPELAIGLPPHSDHGLLNILHTNGVPGLEVKHNGKWVKVKPNPDAFLVNTADHLEIASNGRYKSVLHRALVNNQSTRMSVSAALGPSLDAIVVPAPQLVDSASHPAAFRGMMYREFLEIQQGSRLKEKSVLDTLRLHGD